MAEVAQMGIRLTEKIPLEDILWVPNITIATSKFVYYVLTLLLHLLPALMIDTVLKIAGKKPM